MVSYVVLLLYVVNLCLGFYISLNFRVFLLRRLSLSSVWLPNEVSCDTSQEANPDEVIHAGVLLISIMFVGEL